MLTLQAIDLLLLNRNFLPGNGDSIVYPLLLLQGESDVR